MKRISKYRVEYTILVPLFIMAIISISSIFSAQNLLTSAFNSLAIKQTMWFIIGLALSYSIMFLRNEFLERNAWMLYGIGVLSLFLLLFFATPVNGSKCWFVIPGIGNIQPSEFMKVFLIIINASIIHKFNETAKTTKDEFFLILKILLITGIPAILTFMQPDTGAAIIYFVISTIMLLISGIKLRWFVIGFLLIGLVLGTTLFLFFNNQDLFIKIFGTNIFYRLDRLFDWRTGSGMQLENSLIAIGSAGLFGHGFANTPIYFPEPQADFIFAVFASNWGLFGSLGLILLLLGFDIKLIHLGVKSTNDVSKYIIAGIVGMLLFQQLQNIGMTMGILPIMGITLPFISYGGSSLLSYMIIVGLIFNISNDNLRFMNKKNLL